MWSIKHADISTPEFPASIIAGPESYSEAISFQIPCKDQAEIAAIPNDYWELFDWQKDHG